MRLARKPRCTDDELAGWLPGATKEKTPPKRG